jgi:hypothetical protein
MTLNKAIKKGSITPALIIIAGAFIVAIYAILFVLTIQFDFSNRQVASEKALHIADAGINYYRFVLSQNPNDYQDGTGEPGPYVHDFVDPQGTVVGQYSLEIIPPEEGSEIITIISTAWTNQYPRVKRRISAQYGKVSLTRYAFLHNSNLWFGSDITIDGPVFSNGGIRQDGRNNSTVQSARENYTCGLESGCNNPETKPGVWGTGREESLWEYPVNPIDFDSIRVNFTQMKSAAQNTGLYLPPSGEQGYEIIFSADGTFNVFRVTGVAPLKAYSLENECENLNELISSKQLLGTYNTSENGIIFIEDDLWLKGTVNGKTTLAAARFPIGAFPANIFLTDNLVYLEKNGNHKLGLIGEKDIIITRDVPEYFEMNGAFLAQNGRIIRHHYGYFGCRSSTGQQNIKNELTLYGSLISNQRSYWNFSSGPRSPASGFVKSNLNYDQSNFQNPPPYFPTSGQLNFISWSEEKI